MPNSPVQVQVSTNLAGYLLQVNEALGVLKAAGYKETRVSKGEIANKGPEKPSSGEPIMPEVSEAATASVTAQNATPSEKMEELKIS